MATDTIAAIASPKGIGAIAILRISGVVAISIARQLLNISNTDPEPWKMLHRWVWHPKSQQVIDEVMCCFMKAPHSYTGEDMVEIYCHGGYIAPKSILSLLIQLGCRQAEPGEFTQRALNNGKIDLVQAEFIQQISNAKTEKELELSIKNVSGHLSREIATLKSMILEYVIWAEAVISFPDQIEEQKSIMDLLPLWKSKASYLIDQYHKAIPLSEGFHIAIVGKTNVGKSSLFNVLSGKERSLISPYASTTHDYIQEQVVWNGYPITLYDTAGWVSCPNPVDKLCMEQTEQIIKRSSFILLVIDLEDHDSMDLPYIKTLDTQYSKKTWLIVNKVDLNISYNPEEQLHLPFPLPVYSISAKTGQGISELKEKLVQTLPLSSLDDLECLVNDRWNSVLIQVMDLLKRIDGLLQPDDYIDMVIADLKQIQLLLDEQLGYNLNETLYHQIFQKFCIGK